MKRIFILLIISFSCNFNACSENTNDPDKIMVNPVVSQISTTFTHKLDRVEFLNSNTGYAVGRGGIVIKTTDGGDNWFELNSGINNSLNSVKILNQDTIIACGWNTIIRTTDGGTTWNSFSLPTNYNTYLKCIDFHENIGWAVGQHYYTDTDFPYILRSTNAGLSWTEINTDEMKGSLSSILFLDQSRILIGVDKSHIVHLRSICIYKSTDGGNSFYKAFTDTLVDGPHYLASYDNTKIFGSGVRGILFRSTNAGEDWTRQRWVDSVDLYHIYPVSNDLAFSCDEFGNLIYTEDGGNSWDPINTGTSSSLSSIDSPEPGILIIVGYDGTILKVEY